MKFLTTLSDKIAVGHVPDEVSLADAFAKRHDWKKLITETQALVVLVCFEPQDVVGDLKQAANIIDDTFRIHRKDVHTICLVPFAHLSLTTLHDSEKTRELLYKLHRLLVNKEKTRNVACVPVGEGNIFMSQFLFFDKLNSVKFRSSHNSLKEILISLVRVYGLRKVAAVMADLIPTNNKL